MLSTMFAAFLAVSSLTHVVTSLPLGQLIVGRNPGVHDVVFRGEYNLEIGNQNPWRTHLDAVSSVPALPNTKFYFTLQPNATGGVTSTTVRLHWSAPLSNSAHFIAGTRASWGNWNDSVTLEVTDDPGTHWFEFFPPTGSPIADDMPSLPWTGCSNAQDGTATGLFSIHLDDPNYDNVDFATTTKDCTWPAIGFGEDTASILRQVDIIEPNRLSNTPNLRSRPSVMYQINGNNPTRSVVMTSQVRLGTWAAESQAFYAVAPADTSNDRVQIVLDSEIPDKGIVTTGYADAKPLSFVQLTFRALCTDTAIMDREFSTIEVPVYIGFSRPWVLAIFNVTCTPESKLDPFGTLNVTVQPSETINPDFSGWEVIENGRVMPLFTPGGKLADFLSQQPTMNFLFKWRDPTASNAIYKSKFNVQALSGTGVTRGSVVELRNDRNNEVISQSREYQWPNSGSDNIYSFPLKMQLNCPNKEATISVWQVSIENLRREVGSNTVQYSPVQFRFTFPCNWPKFALSTINNGASTAWDLYSNGLPILGTTGNREVINKVVVAPMTDTVITTYLSDHQLTDVIYFYQQPDANIINREYTWSLAPSQNLQDAVVEMDFQSMNDNRSHTVSWRAPTAGVLQELRITRFTCQAKGTVRLETWLRFGYTSKVQLIWERVCTNNVPDEWDNGSNSSSSLDDGAIFGIIVAVLFAVGCLIGVCYNSIKLGKTGLSVIPGMDSFNAWNDGVKAPNRYSTDISQKASKSKVADVEIHSLGYGSYQQSDDGYVDEIDTL